VTHPGFAAYGAGSPELANAQASLLTAYSFAEAQTPDQPTITGVNLAGQTLGPGVYNSTSGILISGPTALTLDGGGDPSSVFIFQAASSGDLTVDPTSSVAYTNGAQPCNVFWKVNSAFLKNTDETFVGTILALTQITLTENITVEGRVLARNADVTFIHDTVNKPTCAAGATTTTASSTTTSESTPETTSTTTAAAAATVTTTSTATTTAPSSTTRPAVLPEVTPKPKQALKKWTETARRQTARRQTARRQTAKRQTARSRTTRSHGYGRPPRHEFGLTG
jgi:type VI secretion system secreted protein VgrG